MAEMAETDKEKVPIAELLKNACPECGMQLPDLAMRTFSNHWHRACDYCDYHEYKPISKEHLKRYPN